MSPIKPLVPPKIGKIFWWTWLIASLLAFVLSIYLSRAGSPFPDLITGAVEEFPVGRYSGRVVYVTTAQLWLFYALSAPMGLVLAVFIPTVAVITAQVAMSALLRFFRAPGER